MCASLRSITCSITLPRTCLAGLCVRCVCTQRAATTRLETCCRRSNRSRWRSHRRGACCSPSRVGRRPMRFTWRGARRGVRRATERLAPRLGRQAQGLPLHARWPRKTEGPKSKRSLKRRRSARVPSWRPPMQHHFGSFSSNENPDRGRRPKSCTSSGVTFHIPHLCPSLPTHTQPHLAHKSHPLSRAPRSGAITTTRPKAKSAESTRPNHGELLASRARPLPLLSCTAIVPGTSLPGGDGSRIRPSRAACPMRSPLTPRPGPHTLGLVI
jgi:hypothetical protein